MQAEATDSSLREGIEALGVKDTEKSAATVKEDDNTEQPDAEMADATEDDSAAKDGTSKCIHINNTKTNKGSVPFNILSYLISQYILYILLEKLCHQFKYIFWSFKKCLVPV